MSLHGADLEEFVRVANDSFEQVQEDIEARHPALLRKVWRPENYIDKVLKPDMFPID